MRRRRAPLALLSLLLGCTDTHHSGIDAKKRDQAVAQYAALAYATYDDCVKGGEALLEAIDAFVASPSAARLDAARRAWLDARPAYLQCEVFRFYDGPIDAPALGPEGYLNAWPLDEAHIDYVIGEPGSGIINDPSIALTETSLRSLNESPTEESIATGYRSRASIAGRC